MLLSRSYWLPSSLHRIGCSSSRLSHQTLKPPLVILGHQHSASLADASGVCWAARNGGRSGSSGSKSGSNSKLGPHSKPISSTSSSNNKSKLSSSSSNGSTRNKGSSIQPLQNTSRASTEQLEAPSRGQDSTAKGSKAAWAQQQVTGRHSTYSSRSSKHSSGSSSSSSGFSSAPKSSPLPGEENDCSNLSSIAIELSQLGSLLPQHYLWDHSKDPDPVSHGSIYLLSVSCQHLYTKCTLDNSALLFGFTLSTDRTIFQLDRIGAYLSTDLN